MTDKRGMADQEYLTRSSLRHLIGASAVALVALGIGCEQFDVHRLNPFAGPTEVIGRSVEGRPISATVIGDGGPTYLILGVVHGNEPLGQPILDLFTDTLIRDPGLTHHCRVVIVPTVNPDGLARKTRHNARGVDLNRNFPSRDWRGASTHGPNPASEPETRAIVALIERYQPHRILTIHSPLQCINYDGPAAGLAYRVARRTPYRVKEDIGYPTPGSLGSYAGLDLATPTITVELRGGLTMSRAWSEIAPGLLAFLDADSAKGDALVREVAPLSAGPAK